MKSIDLSNEQDRLDTLNKMRTRTEDVLQFFEARMPEKDMQDFLAMLFPPMRDTEKQVLLNEIKTRVDAIGDDAADISDAVDAALDDVNAKLPQVEKTHGDTESFTPTDGTKE